MLKRHTTTTTPYLHLLKCYHYHHTGARLNVIATTTTTLPPSINQIKPTGTLSPILPQEGLVLLIHPSIYYYGLSPTSPNSRSLDT